MQLNHEGSKGKQIIDLFKRYDAAGTSPNSHDKIWTITRSSNFKGSYSVSKGDDVSVAPGGGSRNAGRAVRPNCEMTFKFCLALPSEVTFQICL